MLVLHFFWIANKGSQCSIHTYERCQVRGYTVRGFYMIVVCLVSFGNCAGPGTPGAAAGRGKIMPSMPLVGQIALHPWLLHP
jgi:hypothetical protein